MNNKVVTLRVPQSLLELAAIYTREQHIDTATTIRQWLYRMGENYALRLVEEGRLSASRAAELLEVSLYDLYRLAEDRGLALGATAEQYQKSLG